MSLLVSRLVVQYYQLLTSTQLCLTLVYKERTQVPYFVSLLLLKTLYESSFLTATKSE